MKPITIKTVWTSVEHYIQSDLFEWHVEIVSLVLRSFAATLDSFVRLMPRIIVLLAIGLYAFVAPNDVAQVTAFIRQRPHDAAATFLWFYAFCAAIEWAWRLLQMGTSGEFSRKAPLVNGKMGRVLQRRTAE
jgi:hypothetical protein